MDMHFLCRMDFLLNGKAKILNIEQKHPIKKMSNQISQLAWV